MADVVVFCLFGGAAALAALSGLLPKVRPLMALLAAVCVVGGVLAGLARGTPLAELLSPMLIVCAAALAALLLGKGDGQG